MISPRLAGLALALFAVASARADLTLRWSMNFKLSDGLPKQMTDMAASQAGMMPSAMTIRYRDGRAAMEQGALRIVADYDKGTITMFHPESKRLATMSSADYPPKMAMPDLPPEAKKMFEQMKFDVQTRKPGRTETIMGIKADENEILMALSIPTPMMPMDMKFVMSHWVPTAAEVERVPALRQCAAFVAKAKGTMDPASMLQKAFANFPGAGDKFKAAFDEMMKTTTNIGLRMRMTIIMPGLAKMLEPMKAKGLELPPNFDGTIGAMTMELDQLDEKPVPESAFAVPAGYEKVPMEELFKELGKAKPHSH